MLLQKLLKDESGFLIAGELVLVSTILTLGMIVGLTSVRHAVVQELEDVADSYYAVNSGHRYSNLDTGKVWSGSSSPTSGSHDIAGGGY